jgi:methylmalonyl-CoA/ethylmalonyl-CoA epimerase
VTDLDHVAIATRDPDAAIATLVGTLGGIVVFGGDGTGFRWVQVRMGDATTGMTVEVLTVWRPEDNDFLERFLARHGDRQHHLTFKVRDLVTTLERFKSAGYTPVNVNLSDPSWKEAFLLPREAHGTVVQLAQTSHDEWSITEQVAHALDSAEPIGEPVWWSTPPPRAEQRAVLRRAVLRTPSLPAAVGFFAGMLEGNVASQDPTSAELVWPGGARLLLEESADAPPGFARLEGEIGAETHLEISGASFVLA